MSALEWIGVGVLGGVGALARVSLEAWIGHLVKPALWGPARHRVAGTFAVNLSGACLLGLVDGLALSGEASVLVGTAALGAYTTFSTWMLQSRAVAVDGPKLTAAAYVVGSLLLGFGAVALGRLIGAAL